MCILA